METIKKFSYVDIALLSVSVLLTGFFIYWELEDHAAFLNETGAMILFCLGLLFKLFDFRRVQGILFFLFLLPLFQLINLSFTVNYGNESVTYNSGSFVALIFSPVVLLIMIAYLAVHIKVLKEFLKKIFHGSVKERKEKQTREINFYYERFSTCSPEELANALKMYDEYPEAGQLVSCQ